MTTRSASSSSPSSRRTTSVLVSQERRQRGTLPAGPRDPRGAHVGHRRPRDRLARERRLVRGPEVDAHRAAVASACAARPTGRGRGRRCARRCAVAVGTAPHPARLAVELIELVAEDQDVGGTQRAGLELDGGAAVPLVLAELRHDVDGFALGQRLGQRPQAERDALRLAGADVRRAAPAGGRPRPPRPGWRRAAHG